MVEKKIGCNKHHLHSCWHPIYIYDNVFSYVTQPWSYCVCTPEIGPADALTQAFTTRTSLLIMRVLLPTALFQPHIAAQKLVQMQVVCKTMNEMHSLVLRKAIFGAIAVDCADALGGCSAIYPNRAHSLEHICSLQSSSPSGNFGR